MKINWIKKNWEEISLKEFYAVLRLRSEVFVVEQDCVYQDIDNKDQKAIHLMGYINNELVAYSRIFNKGDYFKEASIGRVVVAKNLRHFNYGSEIMEASIDAIKKNFNTNEIKISAQLYLKDFYNSFGFKTTGSSYLEDGIPHIAMIIN